MGTVDFDAKGIIFDLDGTIVDSRNAYLEAARTAFKAMGQEPPTLKIALEIPRSLELKQPISNIFRKDPREFLDLYLETYYAITKEKTKLIANIPVTLERLSKKAPLAIVTMRSVQKQAIIEELEHFGIAHNFTHIITALDTFEPKPAPEALTKTSQAVNVPVSDCIIVGDSVCDIRAGKAAGAKTVAVLSGLFSYEELVDEHPDLILKDATALPNHVK
jgi:HAD superfamily hydrolase (TIGR01509 family)